MIADFFTLAFTLLVLLAFWLVKLILLPIDLLIESFLPGFGDALANVADFFDIITEVIGWVISLSGIPATIISLLAVYLIFKYTLPVQIWFIKLAIKWYKAIKP